MCVCVCVCVCVCSLIVKTSFPSNEQTDTALKDDSRNAVCIVSFQLVETFCGNISSTMLTCSETAQKSNEEPLLLSFTPYVSVRLTGLFGSNPHESCHVCCEVSDCTLSCLWSHDVVVVRCVMCHACNLPCVVPCHDVG